MKRYTFLLIAFFLTNSALATGLNSLSNIKKIASINTNPKRGIIPDSNANRNVKLINTKKISPSNSSEIIKSEESTISNDETNNVSQKALKIKKLKTSSNNKICKTKEGIIFYQGDAGHNDCILKVKNDRQVIKNVP